MTDTAAGNPRNILLVGPDGPAADELGVDLISEAPPEETHLLNVTFDRKPDEFVGQYRARHGRLPAKTGVIEVGGQTRSAATSAPAGPGPAPVTVEAVSDPSDLTGLSMAISAYLDAWEDGKETPVVCFDSRSAWLSQTNESRVFAFLHSIVGRLRESGAVAHFRINPEINDEATINRFASLMDAVIRVHEDGDTSTQTRRQAA